MTENQTTSIVDAETEDEQAEREDREWRERAAKLEAQREELKKYVPQVGDVLYRNQSDPFDDAKDKRDKRWISVAVQVTRVTKTRFTTEDGSVYNRETRAWRFPEDENGDLVWVTTEYGQYKSDRIYGRPLHETVYTLAELKEKRDAHWKASKEAADRARRAKLAELGLDAYLAEVVFADPYDVRPQMRLLTEIATEEQKDRLLEAITEIAIELGRKAKRAADVFEQIERSAHDAAKRLSPQEVG